MKTLAMCLLAGVIGLMGGQIFKLALKVSDLQHDIKRLEAKIDSHENILVPKHLQGSAGPYKDEKPVDQR